MNTGDQPSKGGPMAANESPFLVGLDMAAPGSERTAVTVFIDGEISFRDLANALKAAGLQLRYDPVLADLRIGKARADG